MLDIPFTIRKIPARIVVGISRRTSNADGRSTKDMMAAWTDFLQQNAAAKIRNRALPPAMYAVYSDYESDWRGEYSYLLGCGVTRAGGFRTGWRYGRSLHRRTLSSPQRDRCRMRSSRSGAWSGCPIFPRTYTFDFEVYDQRFTNPKAKEVDICVAIDPGKMEQMQ